MFWFPPDVELNLGRQPKTAKYDKIILPKPKTIISCFERERENMLVKKYYKILWTKRF